MESEPSRMQFSKQSSIEQLPIMLRENVGRKSVRRNEVNPRPKIEQSSQPDPVGVLGSI